jgi:hypothetical protein
LAHAAREEVRVTRAAIDYGALTDRELDALFGCKSSETSMDLICVCGIGVDGVSQDWPAVHWLGGTEITAEGEVHIHGEGYIPLFASTWAGAGRLLTELRSRDWFFSLLSDPAKPWHASVIQGVGRSRDRHVHDANPTRAIAIVVLLALDAEASA